MLIINNSLRKRKIIFYVVGRICFLMINIELGMVVYGCSFRRICGDKGVKINLSNIIIIYNRKMKEGKEEGKWDEIGGIGSKGEERGTKVRRVDLYYRLWFLRFVEEWGEMF